MMTVTRSLMYKTPRELKGLGNGHIGFESGEWPALPGFGK